MQIIRRVQISDLSAFRALWNRTFAEGVFIPNAPPSEERILPVLRRVVAEQISNFVALDGDSLLGFVEVFPGTMCGKSGEDADLTGMLGIQVDASYRRQGLGRKLMRVAIDDSIRRGFRQIELHVLETNLVAIRLHESLGFEDAGSGKKIVLLSGMSTLYRVMTLRLSSGS